LLKIRLYLAIAACAALIGCNSSKPADGNAQTTEPSVSTTPGTPKNSSAKENSGDLSAKPPAGKDGESQKEPAKVAVIPDSLKSQALDYFGVYGSGTFVYEVVSSDGSSSELKRELKVANANQNEAVIEESASSIGGVQKFEHVVKKDGVYSRQIYQDGTKGTLQLALPARLAIGAKWTNKTKVEVNGKLADMSSSSKIVGFEKLNVGGKTYDTVKLSEKASLAGDNPEEWKTTTWLAKGAGLIKMEIDRTPKGQPTVKSTMTLK
jgi:hypothetical protein